MKEVKVSDQIYENLVRTGNGDASYGLVIFWETGVVLTEIVSNLGMISFAKKRSLADLSCIKRQKMSKDSSLQEIETRHKKR